MTNGIENFWVRIKFHDFLRFNNITVSFNGQGKERGSKRMSYIEGEYTDKGQNKTEGIITYDNYVVSTFVER